MKMATLCATLLIAIMLVGCAASDGIQTESNILVNPTTSDAMECALPYQAYDMETFLADWSQIKRDPSHGDEMLLQSEAGSSNVNSMVIPVSHPEDYRLFLIEATATCYIYHYVPSDHDSHTIPEGHCFTVRIYKQIAFSDHIERYGLSATDGVAYHQKLNEWLLDNDGMLISIRFPKEIKLENASMLNQYFTFETYPTVDNLETE